MRIEHAGNAANRLDPFQAPSEPSCHARRSSASMRLEDLVEQAWASGSSIGTNASIRRSRLRSMRSPEPMSHSGSPPFSNRQIRECSRNSPMIDRTRIAPTAPDARDQRARAADDQVDLRRPPSTPDRARRCTPGRRGRSSSGRSAPAGPPSACSDLAIDELEEPLAQPRRRDEQPAERPLAGEPGQDVEQVADVRADLGPAVSRPRSTYAAPSGCCSCPCRCGRSGAGPRPSRRTTSSVFQCVFRPDQP